MQITPKLEIFISSPSPFTRNHDVVFKKSDNQVAFPFMCDEDDDDEDVNASSHQIFNSTTLKNNKTNYIHLSMYSKRDTY
jgi:hypothetical protein